MPQVVDLARARSSVPTNKNGKVLPPIRKPNAALRRREHLTPSEMEDVIHAAGRIGRQPHRDRTLIMLMYRHALRVGEAVSLRWDQIDMREAVIHVARLKNGRPSTHPLRGPELRALRRLKREGKSSAYVFASERGGPLSTRTARHIVTRAGQEAGLTMPIHAHMCRHSCGYYLANKGFDTRAIQEYFGHTSIQNTTRYTELSASRFKDFWKD